MLGFNCTCANSDSKLPLQLKLDEYDSKQKLWGVKKVQLNPMSVDTSFVRERILYEMYNDFGLTTARAAYVRLFCS